MGLRFPLDVLDKNLKIKLRELLIFEPQVSYLANPYEKNPEPIKFYTTSENSIKLPYMVGKTISKDYGYKAPKYDSYKFNMNVELRKNQVPVIEEAYAELEKNGCVVLALHTGFGKTVVATSLASRLGGKVIIFYTRIFLGTSWSKTFEKYSDCKNYMIVESRKSIENWLKTHDDIPDVLLLPVTRVDWVPEKIRRRYKGLIVDEAHEFCTRENCKKILGLEPGYVISLTATPNRQDGLFKMMETLSGNVIYRPSKRPFKVHKVETGFTPETKLNRMGRTDWSKFVTSVCEDRDRNKLILELIKVAEGKKVLVLTSRKAHLETISKMLTKRGITHSSFYGKLKSYSDSMVVLGTFKKMSTGFDEEMACPDFCGVRFNLLILVTSLKDHLVLEQSIGRVFRIEKPDIIDMVDDHPISERHWKSRRRFYKKHKGKIM